MADDATAAEAQEAKSKGVSVEELRKINAINQKAQDAREEAAKQSGSDLLYAITGRPKSIYTFPRGNKDK